MIISKSSSSSSSITLKLAVSASGVGWPTAMCVEELSELDDDFESDKSFLWLVVVLCFVSSFLYPSLDSFPLASIFTALLAVFTSWGWP